MLRHLRSYVPLAIAFLAAPNLASPARAQTPWNHPATVHAKDQSLAAVLRDIASTTKTRIELTAAAQPIADAATITTSMDEVPLRTVLESLIRVVNPGGKRLSVRFEDDRCIIDAVESPAGGGAGGGRALGAPADRSPDRRLVTYEASGVTALQALTDLLDKMNVGYRIHPAVRKAMNGRINKLTVRDVELRSVLGQLVQTVHLPSARVMWWYEQDPGCYVFAPEPIVEQPILLDDSIAIQARDEPVAAAIKRAFDSTNASYAFSPQILGDGTATVSVRNKTLRVAVDRMLRSAGVGEFISLDQAGGVYAIRLPSAGLVRMPAEPRYTARFDNADIRYALKALFASTGENYTLDSHVSGAVTTSFQNLPLREALEQTLKSSTSPLSLTWRLDGNVYKVFPNRDWESWK